ncbi:MAG: glycosyltransferase [Akkermansiaceae bacterium]|nr:glycosyltransferase [Akkermansiaceae bacterium]NNM29071.1 glycosyltransferase [Akkermansiaceae bacterium]
MKNIAYTVITPARDEADHLEGLISSMASQSVRPVRWVIVNDGSTDATGAIADEAAASHGWIRVVHREDRGHRKAGGGVIDAFYDGMRAAEDSPFDYIVKLDGDLSFAKDYFERCFEVFAAEPHLGIAGGTVCLEIDGNFEPDSKVDPSFHVRGATKIYRRECWEAIGGLLRQPGWDTVDEVKANMLGWNTRTLADVRVVHQRPTGEAYGKWRDMMKGGRANFVAGYHPVFMCVKCVKRLFNPPYITGSLALFWGYLTAGINGVQRVPDPTLIRYFHQQQWNRLFLRKSLWG